MMSLFFDATYFGKLHWREPGSTEVLACAATADELVCSMHGRAEFYSIGFRKVREGLTVPSTLQAVFAQFHADIAAGDIRLLPLTDAIIDRVGSVFATAPDTTYLRAADALHLATAAGHGFAEIFSNDKHLLAAAPLFGLRVRIGVRPNILGSE
jgi:predicted nucleic acid-binding protein